MTTAMVIGGAALAIGQHAARQPAALAGGWASLELINPLQVAVVDVPVVIDAQILQHGVMPNPDFGGSIRFTHETSGATQTLRLEVISRSHAIARGEHTFTEPGAWGMATLDMGPEIELGTVEVVAPGVDEVISTLRPTAELASACGEAAGGVDTEILDGAFADPVLEVAAGTTVTWVNTSPMAHQVTFNDAAIASSAMLHEGDAFSVTFAEPGSYSYYCAPHPHMTGVVEVVTA
jgi:plastocyanin